MYQLWTVDLFVYYGHKKVKIFFPQSPRTNICSLGGDIALVENAWDGEPKCGQVTEALKFLDLVQ